MILAAPVLAIRQLMQDLAPHLPTGVVVTDVASTKASVENWANRFLPVRVRFVGGHPMAGKETAGLEHADATLFRQRTWCVVHPPRADAAAVELVARLAADTGATVVHLNSAEEHDRAVAATSHLPFTLSAILARAVIGRDDFGALEPVAATGLRDMTRLASGDVLMHRDICITNRDALVDQLESFAALLKDAALTLRRMPDADSAVASEAPAIQELEELLRRAKRDRDDWLGG